jgi:hypothetical protein
VIDCLCWAQSQESEGIQRFLDLAQIGMLLLGLLIGGSLNHWSKKKAKSDESEVVQNSYHEHSGESSLQSTKYSCNLSIRTLHQAQASVQLQA